jgi:hypothetical protein
VVIRETLAFSNLFLFFVAISCMSRIFEACEAAISRFNSPACRKSLSERPSLNHLFFDRRIFGKENGVKTPSGAMMPFVCFEF